MTRVIARLELNWWPVGQGLFATGRLHSWAGGTYSWVYDCGSSSGASVRDAAIRRYAGRYGARHIELVTLSHFDADHINGIETLVRGRTIGTVLLPYLPLWQRLLVALDEGIDAGNALFPFFVDPAAYLAGIEGAEIREVVFVPAVGPDDHDEGGEGPDPAPDGDPDGPISGAKVEEGPPPDDYGDDPAADGAPPLPIRFLRPAGRIVIPALWEFMPYNDAQMLPRVTQRFTRRAARIARHLVRRPARRALALKVLQRLYDRTFGAGSGPRNLISLFLYSGPVGTRIEFERLVANARVRLNAARDNFAQLSTGDGSLDTPARLDALRRFYARERRFDRAGILQVMHHGASGNSHDGVAAALRPAVSIFCSDPVDKRYRHPHADVVRDFWTWCPVQVDRDQGFNLCGLLMLR